MMDDVPVELLNSTRFWIQSVFVPILVFIGVTGNIITIMVLTRKKMRCSTNIYLTALAVADIIYLLFVFALSFTHYSNIHDIKYVLYWRFNGIMHWLADAASSTSIWLTVSFTIERYIAVCHPIKGKVLCTENRAKSIIVIVTILCVLTTASTAFEYQLNVKSKGNCSEPCDSQQNGGNNFRKNVSNVVHHPSHTILVTNLRNNQRLDPASSLRIANEVYSNLRIDTLMPINCTQKHPHIVYVPIYATINTSDNRTDTMLVEKLPSEDQPVADRDFNGSADNETAENRTETKDCCKMNYVDTEPTALGNNKNYKSFISWYSAITFGILPVLLIALMNCFLVHAVHQSRNRRCTMTNRRQDNVSSNNENRITIMLIGVVILFLICQSPTAFLLIYECFHESDEKASQNKSKFLGNIFNLLMTINAACNFLLYCVLSKKYRLTFKALFCEGRKVKQDTLLLTSTTSKSKHSQRFNPNSKCIRRNISEYRTPRNLETQSLTSMPRAKSLMMRMPGKSKSTDLNV